MKHLRSPKISGLAICVAVLSAACSDDEGGVATDVEDASSDAAVTSETETSEPSDVSTDGVESSTTTAETSAASSDAGSSEPNVVVDGSVDSPDADTTADAAHTGDDASTGGESSTASDSSAEGDTSGSTEGEVTRDSTNGESSEPPAPVYPQVPALFSVTGCTGIGPLCTISQEGAALTANCGGRVYTGTVDADRRISLAAEPEVNAQGATLTRTCVGEVNRRGKLVADCAITTGAVDATPEATVNCEMVSDATVLPSVECAEVPSELTNVVLCAEGEGAGGETIAAGACKVVQDGCAFQAECEEGLTLVGEVRGTELRFTQALTALADAQTPANGGSPAFLAGAVVNHSCVATLDGTALAGSCGAGSAGRGGSNTSVCSVGGAFDAQPQCDLLAPSHEVIFALDSCDPMKNGGEGEPGIGEPLCAFRQNNCIWEVQCGRDMEYTGRLQPGATAFNWRLETGTQCEGGFTEAGAFNGVCSVPDLFSCNLWSKDAVPGGEACPSAPVGLDVTSRGCGNGSGEAMECRELMWHGCDFMAICSFSYMESLVFAGTASESKGVGRVDLTGIGPYECYAVAPSEADLLADPYRAANEWIGQCETEAGAQCRSNFNAATGEGFRGLQLYWGAVDEPEEPTAQ